MRIAVVGAGIAGLRTAQLLERIGVQVTVFEGRGRIGGRLWTTTVGEQRFEAGGEWLDAEHARVFALLGEMGLSAVASDTRPRRYFFCDRFVERPGVEARDNGGESLKDVLDRSAQTFVERAYLEAVALSDEGTDSDRVDADEWRRFAANYSGRSECNEGMSAYRFPVSACEVCERMAGVVHGDVRLNAGLAGVSDGTLRFANGRREEFDEVVLTLPPTCLDGLDFDGPRVWEGMAMTPTCKVALLFDRSFWEDSGWSGAMMSDLAVQQVWACGRALVCYVNGRGAETLAREGDPVSYALESLAQAVPEARSRFVAGRLVDWRADPMAGGGFPYVPVGVRRSPLPSKGPVRFAGDWTANWMGFVEGALESAERVVEEFKNEHGLS